MKKLLLNLCILSVISNSAAFAGTDYQCVAPYDMNSSFRTVVGAVSGVNAITETAAEKIIKKSILKNGSAEKLKVKVESYSSKDLKNGIFKAVQINAQNAVLNDVYLTNVKLNTLCDFNYIKPSGKNYIFVEDFPMSFDIEVSADDLNHTMQSEKYKKIINDLNKLGASYGYGLKISSTKTAIKSGKFYYVLNLEVPLVKKTQKLVLETNVNVKNGKFNYTNTRLVSGLFNLDIKRLDFILNYLNPLDFSVNIVKEKDANIKISSVQLKNNNIISTGTIVIPRD